jgi:hypothetical protein
MRTMCPEIVNCTEGGFQSDSAQTLLHSRDNDIGKKYIYGSSWGNQAVAGGRLDYTNRRILY